MDDFRDVVHAFQGQAFTHIPCQHRESGCADAKAGPSEEDGNVCVTTTEQTIDIGKLLFNM